MKKIKLTLLVTLLFVSGLFLYNVQSQTTDTGNLSSDIRPGETYYYEITDFPTYNQFIDFFDASDEAENLTITGSLEGSSIYVKVINTGIEEVEYWDGSTYQFGNIPIVDVSAGMITGQDLTVTVIIEGESNTQTLPGGSGLPVPNLFGASSQFDATGESILPLPIVLNDDYALHETIINALAADVTAGTLSVDNSEAQFKISATDIELDTDITLNGLVSYRKSDGLLQEVNFEFTNTTSSKVLSFDFDLNKEEYHPIGVGVGDTFKLTVDAADFNYNVDLPNATEDAELTAEFADARAEFNAVEGEILLDLVVEEVDGLYYRVTGTIYNGEGVERIVIPTPADGIDSLWFVGFGRLGPGMPQPINDVLTDYGQPLRQRALPGPFISDDSRIYQAWDQTIATVIGEFITALDEALEEAVFGSNVDIGSSTTDDPILGFTPTSEEKSSGYTFGMSFNFDVQVTVYDEFDPSVYMEITATGDFGSSIKYDKYYALSEISSHADLSISAEFHNGTESESGSISISDLTLTMSSEYSLTDPSAAEIKQAEEDGPLLDLLPGFGFSTTLVGLTFLVAIAIIPRKLKKN